VIGSRYSKDTFRIRDFLSKNLVPYTWLDLETDPDVGRLLQQFGISESETPVVAWGNRLLLRNPSTRSATPRPASWRKPSASAGRSSRPCTT
jgi:thioredoxin reductase (NADPH)